MVTSAHTTNSHGTRNMNLPGIILSMTSAVFIASPALHAEDVTIITTDTASVSNPQNNDSASTDETMQINSQLMAATPPVAGKAGVDKKPDMAVYCREHTC